MGRHLFGDHATLIAAAPDMLAALKEATRCLAWHVEEQKRGVAMDAECLRRARAAIAKAEGTDAPEASR